MQLYDQQTAEILQALARGRPEEEVAQAEGVSLQRVQVVAGQYAPELEAARRVHARRGATAPARGIDISYYQGAPNFERVQKSGVSFVIARAGYGAGRPDAQFARTAAECQRLGLPLGAYWFSYALSAEDAAREARYCLEAVKGLRLEYPIFYDFEYDSIRYAQQQGVAMDGALATAIIRAFCTEVERAKYYAAFYTNADLSRNYLDMAALARFDLWYAWYQPSLNRPGVGMWQYASTGRVAGISGSVDLDESFQDYPTLIRKAGLNGFPARPDTETDYPAGTPAWQIRGFESLVDRGIIDSPDYWKPRFQEDMTAGQVLGILGRL